MRAGVLLLSVAGGCNALFGLEPTQLGDGGSDPRDAGGPDADPALTGQIFAVSLDYLQGGTTPIQGYATAIRFGAPDQTCEPIADAEPCVTYACAAVTPSTPRPHTGNLTVEGDLRLVTVAPDQSGVYPPQGDLAGQLFTTGTTIGVYSDGAEIPSLSSTLIAPPYVTVSSPLPAGAEVVTIKRAEGVNLTWDAVAAGTVLVIVGDSAGNELRCEIPAAGGSAQLLPAALQALQAGSGNLVSYVVVRDVATAGDYQVQVLVAQVTRRSDGDWANGTVILE